MSLVARKWGSAVSLLWLVVTASAPFVRGLERSGGDAQLLASSQREITITTGAEVLCDPKGNLSLQAAQASTYVPLENELPTSDGCSGYWIRINLRAADLPPGGWVLKLSRDWEFAELYSSHAGDISVLQTGTSLSPQKRAIASSSTAFPLPIESGHEDTFYLHLVGDTSRYGEARSIGVIVQRLDTWILQQRTQLYCQGAYAGIILALVLYNLILYLAVRERAYLYYSIYAVSFGSLWIARTGFFYQYLWPSHEYWNSQYQPYLAAVALVFSILFVREFLATRQRSPIVDRFLLALIWLTVVFSAASLAIGSGPLALPLVLIGLVLMIFFAAIGLVALSRGFRPARFFLVAWASLLLGNLIYIFMYLRWLPVNFITHNSAQIGSALECILLAFALADRVNLLKREKEEKQSQYTLELRESVAQRTEELTSAVENLKTASITDPLTGLSNRRHVHAVIQPWIAELQRTRIRNSPGVPIRYLALCLADLDHFKLINDELGHAVGDRVLQAATQTLRQNVRATAILARWGGEEFLVLDHVTAPHEDLLMAERLRLSILDEHHPIFLEIGRSVSLSLGVLRYPFSAGYPELLTWDHCLALADHALYRAKRTGRNRWRCYRPNESALRTAVRAKGVDDIRRALLTDTDHAFEMGWIEIIEQVPSNIQVL